MGVLETFLYFSTVSLLRSWFFNLRVNFQLDLSTKVKQQKETPLMQQYGQIKTEYPGTLLLFRVGDFYELFGEDAVVASKILNIVLTHRNNGGSKIELAGFPYHSLDTYLPKLVRAGQRVAVCEQLEDPKKTKTIVKRGVTELITPGVSANDKTFDSRSNNFLAAIYQHSKSVGVSFADLSTGEFMVAQGNQDYIERLIKTFQPSEIILSKSYREQFDRVYGEEYYSYAIDKWFFEEDYCKEQLNKHFDIESLRGFGIDHMEEATIAAGAVIHYLNQSKHTDLEHINSIKRIDEQSHVWIDSFTIRNLEIIHSNHPTGISLLDVVDKTISPMGSRLMRNWLILPLLDLTEIHQRQDTVEYLMTDTKLHDGLEEDISQIGDLERLISKVALRRINPKELLQLSAAMKSVATVKDRCSSVESRPIEKYADQLFLCEDLVELIDSHIAEDAPVIPSKGGVFKMGVDAELDEYISISKNSKDYLLGLKNREAEKSGISSLKLAFNNVFGYYLEVTHTHRDKVPEEWIRKQTLVNAERYITPELKEFEEKILAADSKISELEATLYIELVSKLNVYITNVQRNSRVIAKLDCLCSFAKISNDYNYTKPEVADDMSLAIKDGRHPVIEQQLSTGENYIPNDIYLNKDEQQIIILTGPNMSGKSAILRQTALTVLLAQVGCFVPAQHAHIGLVDKIYTRVGASDNISQGESTFMVEMVETASILNNLSERSLVILDEIGRGTSTFDGVSLAWSIAEFLNQDETRPKTIFATHYHELNELEARCEGIVNYYVSTEEKRKKVIFLRKMKKGGSEHSFGIHVARMAGIPKKVLKRADTILRQLENDRESISTKDSIKKVKDDFQLNLFQINDPKTAEILQSIDTLNIESLTPIEALMKLNEIKQLLED
ncbi:MAG: DNA mismatch repair protein MutS [Bacteroidetes bacterium]|nr:MAG: DNA mismatch repair protein MutS [Bacteroidota bacterium]